MIRFDPTVTYHGDTHSIYFGRGFWHPFAGWEILLVVTHHGERR